MKNLILLSAWASILIACGEKAPENTVAEDRTAAIYYAGDTVNADEAIDGAELMKQLQNKDSLYVTFSASITDVCQRKGCWMNVDLGEDREMLVRFRDYANKVPMNSAGQTAILGGWAKVDTLSVEWLRHQASDAGKPQQEIDAIVEPEVKYTFAADGVAISMHKS